MPYTVRFSVPPGATAGREILSTCPMDPSISGERLKPQERTCIDAFETRVPDISAEGSNGERLWEGAFNGGKMTDNTPSVILPAGGLTIRYL